MSQLSSSSWRQLPTTPGVYLYTDAAGNIIYVGKANNLKSRVSSYFQPPVRLGPKTANLVSRISGIDYIEVGSETEALLLESKLIRKFSPQYNIVSKDDRSPYYIHITGDVYPQPVINHVPKGALAGPFLNSLIPKRLLKNFRRIVPYCTAGRPVKKPCFYSHLGLCRPCPGSKLNAADTRIYRENILRLKKLLRGQFSAVEIALRKQMKKDSQNQNFELAVECRDHLAALSYLKSSPVSPEEYLINPNLASDKRQEELNSLITVLQPYFLNLSSLRRIEFYDIAHLAGTHATASMTVGMDGQPNTDEYRHFTVKSAQTDSDVDMMREILTRRLKNTSWPRPDLIVLDGGKPQLSIHPDTLIPTIALAKRFETLVIPVKDDYAEIRLPRNHPGLLLLQNLRDEAHRFSRRLHHLHRAKIIS